jgi:hypothetical protein
MGLSEGLGACLSFGLPFLASTLAYIIVDNIAKNRIVALGVALAAFVASAYFTCVLMEAEVLAGISLALISTTFALSLFYKIDNSLQRPPLAPQSNNLYRALMG